MSDHIGTSRLVARGDRPAEWITLRLPVVLLILAATAVPVELRPSGINALGYGFQTMDMIANVLGYVPLGLVLGELGVIRAVVIATLASTLAETTQFVMVFRDPSLVDIGCNILGAAIGVVASARWQISQPGFRIDRSRASIAAALAVVLVIAVWATAGDALNDRGLTAPGILEAHWTLAHSEGRVAPDSSGHGLNGLFESQPTHIRGPRGEAAVFHGPDEYVRVHPSTAFRIIGSMTVSAWIRSTSYPRDDAAIVSNVGAATLGFQLDTTIDSGARTVGFKLSNVCQQTMARYGATTLLLNIWYDVTGVYDAEARTMNVYLNGDLDNGVLTGSVSGLQRSSREPLFIGRRSDMPGYEFSGAIGDVRIYSRALTQGEVAADMGRAAPSLGSTPRHGDEHLGSSRNEGGKPPPPECTWSSEFEDRRLPVAAAGLGVLIAVASVGFAPFAGPFLWLAASPVAGLLLFYAGSPTLPRPNLWTFPLVSLAAAASVVLSTRRASAAKTGQA